MTATYMRPCDGGCGVDVETGGDYPRSRERFCHKCAADRERASRRRYYHEKVKPNTPEGNTVREPVLMLDISPAVQDREWRWQLEGYKGNVLPWRYFKESLPDGSFDGLLIERGGQRFEVVNGVLVQPGDYRQATLLEAHP